LFPQFVVWHKYIVSGSSSFILGLALQLHLGIFVRMEEEKVAGSCRQKAELDGDKNYGP